MPENNGKQNPKKSYTNKFHKHIACSYDYKLVCVDDKFSKRFKTYLPEPAVYNFIDNMIKESKYCKLQLLMKKHFNKELVVTIEDNRSFKNSARCWIYGYDYIENDVKVRDHCHITGKGSAHRDCNINLKLNHKIPVVIHNLNNYDFLKFNFNLKTNVIPNGLEKYMNELEKYMNFVDSFQFLSFSLDSFVKNLSKDGFKYLSQEFDNNLFDLQSWKKYMRQSLVFM